MSDLEPREWILVREVSGRARFVAPSGRLIACFESHEDAAAALGVFRRCEAYADALGNIAYHCDEISSHCGDPQRTDSKEERQRLEARLADLRRAHEERREADRKAEELRAKTAGHPLAWETLGLQPGSSQEDIKRAYRAKAKLFHPDVGGDPRAFRLIQRAYEHLMQARGAA